jgi:hypothetical protein
VVFGPVGEYWVASWRACRGRHRDPRGESRLNLEELDRREWVCPSVARACHRWGVGISQGALAVAGAIRIYIVTPAIAPSVSQLIYELGATTCFRIDQHIVVSPMLPRNERSDRVGADPVCL